MVGAFYGPRLLLSLSAVRLGLARVRYCELPCCD